jgi:signal transduction histidine kinase
MRDQIVLLLGNLLRNAVQAMPSGGTLTLRTETSENEICLAVADTGVGIAPDILDRIFDPFFTTRPTGQGSGLGLSVAHGIAIKHGGRIKVVSEEGKGSEFSVYLPVKSIQQ